MTKEYIARTETSHTHVQRFLTGLTFFGSIRICANHVELPEMDQVQNRKDPENV
jgi:hypothetical protein